MRVANRMERPSQPDAVPGIDAAMPQGDVEDSGAWQAYRELRDAIASAADVAGVAAAGLGRPRLIARMVESGVNEVEVGRVGATLVDAMTIRFADLAMSRLCEPPVPWAWMALGSSARREQAIGTDHVALADS